MDSMTGKKKKQKKPTLAMTDLKRHSMSLFQLLSAAYCSLWGDLLTSSSFIFIIYVYKELLFSVLSSVLLKCPTY